MQHSPNWCLALTLILPLGSACNGNPDDLGDPPCGAGGETGEEPDVVGSWSQPVDWSDLDPLMACAGQPGCETGPNFVAVHAMHLPSGKILYWGRRDHYLWDIETETFEYVEAEFSDINTCGGQLCEDDGDCEEGQTCSPSSYKPDLFCAGHVVMPNGDAFIAGGNNTGSYAGGGLRDVVIFEQATQTWSYNPGRLLQHGRWYPTTTTMADGRVFLMGGTNFGETEAYDPATDMLTSFNSLYPFTDPNEPNELQLAGVLYPFVFVLPDERIFVGGCEDCGNENQWDGVVFDPEQDTWFADAKFDATNRGGSAVMYRPGMVMKAGGGDAPSGTTEVIDLSGPDYLRTASWEPTADMLHRRHFSTFVLLPDGDVLAIGGNTEGNGERGRCATGQECYPPGAYYEGIGDWSQALVNACETNTCTIYNADYAGPLPTGCQSDADCDLFQSENFGGPCIIPQGPCTFDDNADKATKCAELWDPTTKTWTELASQEVERMYHSTALLLPDGRVITMGNGQRQGLISQRNAEFLSPPYLFKGPRPVIDSAPSTLDYGQAFAIMLSDTGPVGGDIGAVNMVKLGSVTHQFDQGQLFIPLDILGIDGNTVTVRAPDTPGEATPGYYMLFVLSDDGVPSVAPYVRMQ